MKYGLMISLLSLVVSIPSFAVDIEADLDLKRTNRIKMETKEVTENSPKMNSGWFKIRDLPLRWLEGKKSLDFQKQKYDHAAHKVSFSVDLDDLIEKCGAGTNFFDFQVLTTIYRSPYGSEYEPSYRYTFRAPILATSTTEVIKAELLKIQYCSPHNGGFLMPNYEKIYQKRLKKPL